MIELMVLALTLLVILLILGLTVLVVVVEVTDPETDTSDAVQGLGNVITTILGALLGLLAGKSESMSRRPDQ